MTTNAVVKLTCGTRTLNLAAGRYKPGDDFVPPAADLSPRLASGSSANSALRFASAFLASRVRICRHTEGSDVAVSLGR